MSKYLNALASSPTCDLNLLKHAHMDWLAATGDQRDAFVSKRKLMVKRMGGCFLEGYDALKMKTSGTTSGAKKTYFWGPSWKSHHDFFEWVKFHPYNVSTLLYLKPIPGCPDVTFTPFATWDSGSYIVAFDPGQSVGHSAKIVHWLKGSRSVLWIMPSYAKLLIDRGFRFDLFSPDAVIIYATGEPSPAPVREHFTSRGYHYLDGMKSWMGGATFLTCKHGNTHWLRMLADVTHGQRDEIVVTDLFNLAQPFMNFETNDFATWDEHGQCPCGLEINRIEFKSRDISLPGGVPFADLFAALNRAISRTLGLGSNDPLLFCSFGYHDKSRSLIIFYEVKNGTPPLTPGCVREFLKTCGLSLSAAYAINGYRGNEFKIAKTFLVTDAELGKMLRSPTLNARASS